MNVNIIKQTVGRVISENATTILTGAGVLGVVATAVLTAKATRQADARIWEETRQLKRDFPDDAADPRMNRELDAVSKAKAVWMYYVPPVIIGAGTIACIVMSHRMSAQKAAALAAAYGISENRLKEYREKMAEKLTGPKNQAINDEIAQDRVNANPPKGEILVLADGEVIFYDVLTDRYFRSTVEKVRQAENEINQELYLTQGASLSEFYQLIGLKSTPFSDIIGWNSINDDGPLKIEFSTALTPDSKPCMTISFNHIPKPDYHKMF